MALIDHGSWTRYRPDTIPSGTPEGAMFAKRDSDGADWYDYVHPHNQFSPTSVKFTVRKNEGGQDVINAPAINADMLFPDSAQIIEMTGDYSAYTTEELITEFANQIIDLETGEITPPVQINPLRRNETVKSDPSEKATEWASGNIYVRENVLAKKGDWTKGHKHQFDHTTYVIQGALHATTTHPDGTILERDFIQGQWFLVRQGVEHEITALEDNTKYHCIYSHRNPQGDVVQEYDGWAANQQSGNYK